MPKYTTRKAAGGPPPVEALKHGDKRKRSTRTMELHAPDCESKRAA